MNIGRWADQRLAPFSSKRQFLTGAWLPSLSLTLLAIAALTSYLSRNRPIPGLSRREAGDFAESLCKRFTGADVIAEEFLGASVGANEGEWQIECRDARNRVYRLCLDSDRHSLREFQRLERPRNEPAFVEASDFHELDSRMADCIARQYLMQAQVAIAAKSMTLQTTRFVPFPSEEWDSIYSCVGADGMTRHARIRIARRDGALTSLLVMSQR